MKTVRLLFSDAMARAIVQGRKTVTRRPVMPHDIFDDFKTLPPLGLKAPCAPGDILIGRECWADVDGVAVYRADGARTLADWRSEYGKRCAFHGCKYCEDCFAPYMWESKPSVETWRPSIHMPDWAARIRRRVVSVTVERLQDITEDDAVREGVGRNPVQEGTWINYPERTSAAGWSSPRESFRTLWDSIYAEKGLGWDSNCWVWRIEFASENVQEVSDGR